MHEFLWEWETEYILWVDWGWVGIGTGWIKQRGEE